MDPDKIFETDTLLTILKWAVTIMLTGFVAQFGKKFAEYIIERVKKKKYALKENQLQTSIPDVNIEETVSGTNERSAALKNHVKKAGDSDKQKKKMLKAELKKQKKLKKKN